MQTMNHLHCPEKLNMLIQPIKFNLSLVRYYTYSSSPQIWIYQISGTLVSRSAMMNAVQHRINVDGHLKAHGGFNFGENNRMGVATVGTSREPINSWLPLYVCDQHWQRVKVDFILMDLIHFPSILF